MTSSVLWLVIAVGAVVVVTVVVGAIYERRLDRYWKNANIRLIGGPFDGVRVDRQHGRDQWPPPETLLYDRFVETEDPESPQWFVSEYSRDEPTGEYRFRKEIEAEDPPMPFHGSRWDIGSGPF